MKLSHVSVTVDFLLASWHLRNTAPTIWHALSLYVLKHLSLNNFRLLEELQRWYTEFLYILYSFLSSIMLTSYIAMVK